MANYRIKKKFRKQVKEWKEYAEYKVDELSTDIINIVGKLFVDSAQKKLDKVPNAKKYKGNIYYNSTNKQVIVRGTHDEPDIMWYLEFGTGIAGKNNPHPKAGENDWLYAIKENTVKQAGSPWARVDGKVGWFFSTKGEGKDDARQVYIAEGDDTNYKNKVFTSGIPPVRYLYDTIFEIPTFIEQAKQILNSKGNK